MVDKIVNVVQVWSVAHWWVGFVALIILALIMLWWIFKHLWWLEGA